MTLASKANRVERNVWFCFCGIAELEQTFDGLKVRTSFEEYPYFQREDSIGN